MSLVDQVSPALIKIRDQLKQTADEAGKAGGQLDNLGGGGAKGGGLISSLRGIVGALGPVALAIGAVGAAAIGAATKLNEMGLAGIEFGDALDDMAGKANISARELQLLHIVAETNGSSLEAMDKSLLDFNRNLGQAQRGYGTARKAFNELGISIKDVNGQFRPSAEIFKEASTAIAQFEDNSRRTTYAIGVFGKAGGTLIDVVGLSTDQWDEADTAIRKYGGYLSNDMVTAAGKARNEMTLIERSTEAVNAAINISLGLPIAVWWTKVKNSIAQTTVSLLEFLNIIKASNGMFDGKFNNEKTDVLELKFGDSVKNVDELEKKVKSLTFAEAEMRNGGRFGDYHTGSSYNYANHKQTKEDLKKYRDELDIATAMRDEIQRVLDSRSELSSDEGDFSGTDYLSKQTAALALSQAKAIDDKVVQERAMLKLTLERLDAEHEAKVSESLLSKEQLEQSHKLHEQNKAAVTLESHNKINGLQKAASDKLNALNSKNEADRLKAIKDQHDAWDKLKKTEEAHDKIVTDITREMNDQSETNDSIINGTEKLLELKRAILRAEEQALANGTKLSDLDRLTIRRSVEMKQLSDDRKKEDDELKKSATASAEAIQDIYKNAAQSIQSSFSDFFFDVMQGNMTDLAASFKRTLDRMVAELLASKLLAAVGGIGNGTVAGGGISGAIGSFFGSIPGRATGGPITANSPYWVGEEGPEIVIPKSSGTVIPADVSQSMSNERQSGESNTYHVSINALDSKSFMDMIENNDRAITNAISQATHRYGIR